MRTVNKKNKKSFSFKVWIRRIRIFFYFSCFFAFTAVCFCSWQSGFIQKKYDKFKNGFDTFLEIAGFDLADVLLKGRVRTTHEELRSALKSDISDKKKPRTRYDKYAVDQQFVLVSDLDLEQIRNKLINLPWVKDAIVQRQLPNILFIKLIERQPIALWQQNQRYYPIDENGEIIHANCEDNLLLLVGKDIPSKAADFIKQLEKYPSIYNRIVSAKLINGLRWNLYIDDIDNGTIVLLSDADLNESLKRLENLQKEQGILDKRIEKIDLRFPDKTIVKPKSSNIISKKGAK